MYLQEQIVDITGLDMHSKPKTLGKERNNKGSSPREPGGKQRWIKSDRLKVSGRIG